MRSTRRHSTAVAVVLAGSALAGSLAACGGGSGATSPGSDGGPDATIPSGGSSSGGSSSGGSSSGGSSSGGGGSSSGGRLADATGDDSPAGEGDDAGPLEGGTVDDSGPVLDANGQDAGTTTDAGTSQDAASDTDATVQDAASDTDATVDASVDVGAGIAACGPTSLGNYASCDPDSALPVCCVDASFSNGTCVSTNGCAGLADDCNGTANCPSGTVCIEGLFGDPSHCGPPPDMAGVVWHQLCLSTAECPPYEECVSGACACSTDTQCPGGICYAGVCVAQ